MIFLFSIYDPTRLVTCPLNGPVDQQKLQHLDQILPCQTGQTTVYTTVRLQYVDKWPKISLRPQFV